MLYEIDATGLKTIEANEICSDKITVGYLSLPELKKQYTNFKFNEASIRECEKNGSYFRTGLDIYDDYSFGIIKITDVLNTHKQKDRIALFLKRNLFIVTALVDEDNSTEKLFCEAIERYKQNVTAEKVVYGVLDRLLLDGNIALENAQDEIYDMEASLITDKPNDTTNRMIFDLKNKMLLQKGYYDQLVDLGEALAINGNDIFEGDNLRYFKIFTDEARRLSANTQILCDSLVHIREAYEASINNNMNRTMKLFTVLSAIFLPLTLLVGWYGMNFTIMPELTWKYGYISVIIESIVIVAFCLIWFSRKKYFK